LLAKAFRGELVPQDPNDEPAAELLERLTMQRAEGGKVRKGSRAKRVAPAALSEEEAPTAVE
jgi:type I restriction enzyme, S subunit